MGNEDEGDIDLSIGELEELKRFRDREALVLKLLEEMEWLWPGMSDVTHSDAIEDAIVAANAVRDFTVTP